MEAFLAYEVGALTIRRILQKRSCEPDDVGRLVAAYEQALRGLGLVDRGDPIAEMVAKKVIQVAERGARDPSDIAALAIMELTTKPAL